MGLRRVKRIAYRISLNLLYRVSSEKYKELYPAFLREQGIRIPLDYREGGHGFIHPSANFDANDFSLISIGKNTTISANVTFLTHDYSITKGLKCIGVIQSAKFLKPISVGQNSFVGMNSILLPGTTIGDNVVIGAGSVVKGVVPDNSIVVGNPARVICTTEEWAEKHLSRKDYLVL